MELKKITPETLRKARKGGFKTKQPKKPARSAKNGTLERYVERYNDWVNRANAAAQAHDKAEKLKRKIFGM